VLRDGQCIAERVGHETSEHELILLAGGQSALKPNAAAAGAGLIQE